MPGTRSIALLAEQTAHQAARTSSLVLWVGLLIGAVLVLGIVVLLIRRHMLAADASSDAGQSFGEELRQMRDRGEISREEYEATRRRLTERLRASLAAPAAAEKPKRPSPPSPPAPPDAGAPPAS